MSANLSGWKKWVVGIGMILAAVATWLVAQFDGDDSTTADTAATYTQVKEGVTIITTDDADDSSSTAGETATTATATE